MTAPTPLDRAIAGREVIDRAGAPGNQRQRDLATALGVELFGDGRLDDLVFCKVCGCLGTPGDLCGRGDDHRLVPR